MNNLLSICIPTYGREAYLLQSLEQLLPDAEALGVEVCISDNCTPSVTKGQKLRKLAEQFNCLHLHFQESNIGLDANMFAAIAMARGRYVYPLGDDDFLPPFALKQIVDDLTSSAPDMLLLDGWHTDHELVPLRRHLPELIRGREYSSPIVAFSDLWNLMPFGSFVCITEAFVRPHWEKYHGTSHAYTGSVWDYLSTIFPSRKCKIVCSALPTVLLRGAEKTWSSEASKIHFLQIPQWFKAMPLMYEAEAMRALKGFLALQTRIGTLLYMRARGQLIPAMLPGLFENLSRWQVCKMWMVAHFPIRPIKLIEACFVVSRKL